MARYYRNRPTHVSSGDRHKWGSATTKQRSYLGDLARQIAPSVDEYATLRKHGAPDDMRSLTMYQASLLIESLKKPSSGREHFVRDPGEDAADRWSESQAGL